MSNYQKTNMNEAIIMDLTQQQHLNICTHTDLEFDLAEDEDGIKLSFLLQVPSQPLVQQVRYCDSAWIEFFDIALSTDYNRVIVC